MIDLSTVAQIEECGNKRANELLAHGFHLLDIGQKAFELPRREIPPGGGKTFISHDIRYVIGRTADQPPFPKRPQ